MLHQITIGKESMLQIQKAEIKPNYMIACVGGGSNFAGFTFPMMHKKIQGKSVPRSSPWSPRPRPPSSRVSSGTTTATSRDDAPDHDVHSWIRFMPKSIHAGGFRYHSIAPLVFATYDQNLLTAVVYDQTETFKVGIILARTEGIVAAPESCHVINGTINKALECKAIGEEKTIVFCLSGHVFLDLYYYEQYP